jgi:hypothetical protein
MSTAQGDRRLKLKQTRNLLYKIPINELFELPGRPHVVYQVRSYSAATSPQATVHARNDVPFLFKAFETGQIGPKKMAKMHGGKARVATIHEYLDWTVTAQSAEEDDELVCVSMRHARLHACLGGGSVERQGGEGSSSTRSPCFQLSSCSQDFGGFRVLVILPRYVPQWPPADYLGCRPGTKSIQGLGAPKEPLPVLQTHGKPVCAATIRSGPGYLEIPFVATHEGKRGRGYCRCMVEAIEDISRCLALKKLMLCSTDDAIVKSTWQHLGFSFTTEEQMDEWDIPHSDLVYLQNTVQVREYFAIALITQTSHAHALIRIYSLSLAQMHKDLPDEPPKPWKPVIIKHGNFKMRMYARIGEGRPVLPMQQPPAKRQARGLPGESFGGLAGPGAFGSGGPLAGAFSSATSMGQATASEVSGGLFAGEWGSAPIGGSNGAGGGKCAHMGSPVTTTQWGSGLAGGDTDTSLHMMQDIDIPVSTAEQEHQSAPAAAVP